MSFREEDYLQLSGIQHYLFCARQWALIHIERQWADNVRTVSGNFMHERVHDPQNEIIRGDIATISALHVFSAEMGVSGECDAVELHKDENGVPMTMLKGKWLLYPIEYKSGSPKISDADRAQLCAQAMCLEEMLCCDIPEGAIYYGKIRHRERVSFDAELRELVRKSFEEMHTLFNRGYTPRPRRTKSCSACSLNNICLPALGKRQDVKGYMLDSLRGDEK